MSNEIREPIQKRSIAKKEKIIKAGFELICDKGYYNTNTAEIAKVAEVSTGIVYQYFNDKHDILIAGLNIYTDSIFFPVLDIPEEKFNKSEFKDVLRKIIYNFIEEHKLSKQAHEEIISMVHSDKEVSKLFYEAEMKMTNKLTNILRNSDIHCDNINEKSHIAVNLIDDLCHEIVYHKHDNINYDKMIDIVIDVIVNMFKE